jgi:hypothetical protein
MSLHPPPEGALHTTHPARAEIGAFALTDVSTSGTAAADAVATVEATATPASNWEKIRMIR